MNAALVPLRNTLQLNTRLFLGAVDGVDETVAVTRPNASTNHIAFISCHLIEARHYLAKCAGYETQYPFRELEGARRLEDVTRFPTLEDIRGAWSDVARMLEDRLPQLSEADLR
ncbi:MAG TPA: DinB family protein [Vicinamibacteria bacterium]